MRLSYVEIAGFRGFRDRTRFDIPAGFAVLTGRNGAGKSTFLDAIDFALTGTINKFAVKGAKGGGLDSHIWWVGDGSPDAHYVELGFIDTDGREIRVHRNRNRGIEPPLDQLGEVFCSGPMARDGWAETLMQTTLIRDETLAGLSLDLPEQARFEAIRTAIGRLSGPDHSDRTKELTKAAVAAQQEQENRLDEVKNALGRALSGLTEARSDADRHADVSEAEKIVREFAPNIEGSPGERAKQIRQIVATRKRSLPVLKEAISDAETALKEERYFASDAGLAEAEKLTSRIEKLEAEYAQVTEEMHRAETTANAAKEADVFATRMVALLDHGEDIGLHDGNCPLCGAAQSDAEFADAIANARARLSKQGEEASAAAKRLVEAQQATKQVSDQLEAAKELLVELQARKSRAADQLQESQSIFDDNELQADSRAPEIARERVAQFQEDAARLEHALFILEASGAHDRVTALETEATKLRAAVEEESQRLADANRAVEAAKEIEKATKSVANQILTEQFDTVLPLLKELYQRLRPHAEWSEIETDFGGTVRASLNLTVGDGRNPQFLFSSGQRRAAGLAFLLAIHLSRPWCKLNSLLLDDPVQHIDDYRALNLVEVLSSVRRIGRQVVVAVEDAALAHLLCRRLRSTAEETGKLFELSSKQDGTAYVENEKDIFPLASEVLQFESTSTK